MATTKGIGIVYGTSITALGFAAAGEITTTSETYERNVEREEMVDRTGAVQTVIFKKRSDTLKVKCYPSGDAAAAGAIPERDEIVIVNADDATVTGNWLVDKISVERKVDGIVEFDLSLIRWLDDSNNPTGVTA